MVNFLLNFINSPIHADRINIITHWLCLCMLVCIDFFYWWEDREARGGRESSDIIVGKPVVVVVDVVIGVVQVRPERRVCVCVCGGRLVGSGKLLILLGGGGDFLTLTV